MKKDTALVQEPWYDKFVRKKPQVKKPVCAALCAAGQMRMPTCQCAVDRFKHFVQISKTSTTNGCCIAHDTYSLTPAAHAAVTMFLYRPRGTSNPSLEETDAAGTQDQPEEQELQGNSAGVCVCVNSNVEQVQQQQELPTLDDYTDHTVAFQHSWQTGTLPPHTCLCSASSHGPGAVAAAAQAYVGPGHHREPADGAAASHHACLDYQVAAGDAADGAGGGPQGGHDGDTLMRLLSLINPEGAQRGSR
eukprot:scaffold89160_cov18-Tisochrysis_lutea.AAC.1